MQWWRVKTQFSNWNMVSVSYHNFRDNSQPNIMGTSNDKTHGHLKHYLLALWNESHSLEKRMDLASFQNLMEAVSLLKKNNDIF